MAINQRMKNQADEIITLLDETFDFDGSTKDNRVEVDVQGIRVEWHWGSAPGHIKLGYRNSANDRYLIEEYARNNFDTEISISAAHLVRVFSNPTINNFIEVINVIGNNNLELEAPIVARWGHVRFDSNNIFLKVARLVEFIVENGLPMLIGRGGDILDRINDQIVIGRSDNWTEENQWREHVVPCDYMMRLAIGMYREGVTLERISEMFECNCKIVLISKEEQVRIDALYRQTMPDGWNWETDSVFIRLNEAEINWQED